MLTIVKVPTFKFCLPFIFLQNMNKIQPSLNISKQHWLINIKISHLHSQLSKFQKYKPFIIFLFYHFFLLNQY